MRRIRNGVKYGKFKFSLNYTRKRTSLQKCPQFEDNVGSLVANTFCNRMDFTLCATQNPSNSIDFVFRLDDAAKFRGTSRLLVSLAGYPRQKHFACPGCRAKLFIDSIIFNSGVLSFFFSVLVSGCFRVSGILMAREVTHDETIGPR